MSLHFLHFPCGVIVLIYENDEIHELKYAKLTIMALFLFVLYFCVRMKRVYLYTLSCLLALSVLFATAGVPLIAHVCSMGCKKEIRVMASEDCCKETHSESNARHIKKGPCCDSETLFLKQELPATKIVKSVVPELPAIEVIQLAGVETIFSSFPIYIQHESPPLSSGRELLTRIQVLRT
jgi:hypothetical protein